MRFSVLSLGTASVAIESGYGIVISQQAKDRLEQPENKKTYDLLEFRRSKQDSL